MKTTQSLRAIGAALPPRRDQQQLVTAAAAPRNDWGTSINVPAARDRMWDVFEREQKPNEVRSTLAAALNGDLHFQALLFTAMMDTWPKLQKSIQEISRMVTTAPWKVLPYRERGEKPEEGAETLASEVETLLWGMKPRAERMEDGLEGTIAGLVRGYYYGHRVAEIRWEKSAGKWSPRCTKSVPARYYGYPYYDPKEDAEDRLMFDPNGSTGARAYVDFEPNRFLIGIHAGHDGHPSVAAPLRALAGYWLAAVYGLKWFMSFTQLYGVPWRHAEVADVADVPGVRSAMAEIGSTGYIITKAGTKINVMEAAKGGDAIPQAALLELADRQCEQFILGQTLTSGTDGSGSRALGEVHQDTLNSAVSGVADFVGGVLTHQLIPAIVAVNYGERSDLPEMWARNEEAKDEKAAAERMAIVSTLGIPVGREWAYEDLGIPVPVDGEDVIFQPAADGVAGDPPPGDGFPHETKPGLETAEEEDGEEEAPPDATGGKKPVKAADATGAKPLTVDQLSGAVLEGLTGVSEEWLRPVRPFFERLAALAMSKHATDDDFLAALERAQRQMPELFDLLDAGSLQTAFEQAIGTGMLAGSLDEAAKLP